MKHKCLASFIVFLLFFSISGVIGFYQIKNITSAEFIKKTLSDSDIYKNIGNLVIESLKSQPKDPEMLDRQNNFYIKALSKDIDPSWAKKEVEKGITSFVDYISEKKLSSDITFDLSDYKKNLPENFREAFYEELKTLSVCPAGEQPKQEIPECIPEGTTPEQIASLLTQEDINSFVNEVPDNLNLSETIKKSEQTFHRIKLAYKIIKYGFVASILLSIILLIILILIGLPSWSSIFRWTAVALLIPSGLNLLMDGIWFLIRPSIEQQLMSGLNSSIGPYLAPIISSLDKNLLLPGLYISGLIFIIGLVLLIISYIIPRPIQEKPQTAVSK